MGFLERVKSGWNAFTDYQKYPNAYDDFENRGLTTYIRPDRVRLTRGNERSIITTIINRIGVDAASVNIEHVRLDERGRFSEVLDTGLNNCLTVSANLDQTSRAFMQDAVMSLLDEGSIAIVPTHTHDKSKNPRISDAFDIDELRVGKIVAWKPQTIRVKLYNEDVGKFVEIEVRKESTAIVENPFYSIMNEPNSTMQRLKNKLALLDIADNRLTSGKLDLLISLPYVVKTESRRQQAEKRRVDIENQLSNSKYGVAYTDGMEKVTQLNRPLENNLQTQVEYLTSMLYSQLGITTEILNGTADERTMLNYQSRIIEPILSAIVDEMKRKFLTKTARSQRQSIFMFRDVFRLVPAQEIANMADVFERNEIVTSNEIRQVLGMKPSDDPKADMLQNSNLYMQNGGQPPAPGAPPDMQQPEEEQLEPGSVYEDSEGNQFYVDDSGTKIYLDENGNPIEDNTE